MKYINCLLSNTFLLKTTLQRGRVLSRLLGVKHRITDWTSMEAGTVQVLAFSFLAATWGSVIFHIHIKKRSLAVVRIVERRGENCWRKDTIKSLSSQIIGGKTL